MYKNISIVHYYSTSFFLQLQFLQPRCPWGYFCCSKCKHQCFFENGLSGHCWQILESGDPAMQMALLCPVPYISSLSERAINFKGHSLLWGCRTLRTEWKRGGCTGKRNWRSIGRSRVMMGESRRAKLLASLWNHVHVT